MLNEQPAKGVTGHLLYSPITKDYFFRVYHEQDKSKYQDYRLAAEDIEITIEDPFVSLVDGSLTWSSRVLGKTKRTNADLMKLAKENPPPRDWFEIDHEKPF